jgi:hypothetical protein
VAARHSSNVQALHTNVPTPTAANGNANSIKHPAPRRLVSDRIELNSMVAPPRRY